MNISGKQIDWLNIVLIYASLLLAILLPFELFLFSYAVLGPLHYLTEINWLKEKSYFVEKRRIIIPMVILGLLFSIIPVLNWLNTHLHFNSIGEFLKTPFMHGFSETSSFWVYFALIIGIGYAAIKNKTWLIFILLTTFLLGWLLRSTDEMTLIFGALVPTIIHVYLFTTLFMLYGALKAKSWPGIISVISMGIAIVIIYFVDFGTDLPASEQVLQKWKNSGFELVNSSIAKVLGIDLFMNRLDIPIITKIQSFIAFAYTYHYLNWFSKTSIIKWHKISKKKLAITLIAWLISLSLYFYNYKTGLVVLFFLSILHVFVEFPLNYHSIKGIIQEIKKGVKLKW